MEAVSIIYFILQHMYYYAPLCFALTSTKPKKLDCTGGASPHGLTDYVIGSTHQS